MPPFGKKSTISIDRPSLAYLSHRGPHRVAAGNLAAAGLAGLVFAPTSGRGLPAVALSHGWLQPAHRYADTMRYLASWGFVVVAPDTQKGPIPSHGAMALDLAAALNLVAISKLGSGRVRVDPEKLGVIGHSIGGGAAVLAAAAERSIRAVVTVTAAATHPSAVEAAARVRAPGLHLVGAAARSQPRGPAMPSFAPSKAPATSGWQRARTGARPSAARGTRSACSTWSGCWRRPSCSVI
jgi:pimeloyl-ACP methyl ester carboxylesterase